MAFDKIHAHQQVTEKSQITTIRRVARRDYGTNPSFSLEFTPAKTKLLESFSKLMKDSNCPPPQRNPGYATESILRI